jgi:Uncharacterized protein conserved in bacteria
MPLKRETSIGTITVSNVIFAELIASGLNRPEFNDLVWAASSRGRLIDLDSKSGISEFASGIKVSSSSEAEGISLEFCVIVKFGTSISSVTDALCDYISSAICKLQGHRPVKLTVRVTGVKSRNIARRDVEVVRHYGAL